MEILSKTIITVSILTYFFFQTKGILQGEYQFDKTYDYQKEIYNFSKLKLNGGSPVALGTFPFIVQFQDKVNNGPFCGGSIINANWVLTSASCFNTSRNASNYIVFAGNVNISTAPQVGSNFTASQIVIYNLYNSLFLGANDVALLKVSTPFVFSANIQPVRLPHHLYIPSGKATAIGVNPTTLVINSVVVPVVSLSNCGINPWINFKRLICGGSTGTVSCGADIGFPLIVTVHGTKNVLVGITSAKIPSVANCKTASFALYTAVTPYLHWIHKTSKDG